MSIVLTVTASAYAQGTTPAVSSATTSPPPAVANRDSSPAAIPGIPNQPTIVTVIPFHSFKGTPWIMVQAEVDGRRGLYSLDTGSPDIILNATYLRPSLTGGLDTVTAANRQQGDVTIHTVRVGSLTQHIDSVVAGLPPGAPYPTNAFVHSFPDNGILGNLGLTGLEPFETIIDYVHQRVVFIRLDKAGRRLAAVPAYTPVGTVPLLPCRTFLSNVPQWWGIQVHHGAVMDTIIVDTGTPESEITEADQQMAADRLKQAVLASHNSGGAPISVITVPGEQATINILGAQFLSRLGVAGFNLRTHQLILYQ